MSGNSLFGKGVLSALAVALVTTAIPATAFAQDERRAERSGRSGGEARRDGGQRGDMQRGGDYRARGAAQAQIRTPQVQPQRAQAPQQQRPTGTVAPRQARHSQDRGATPGWDGTRWNPTNPSQARAVGQGREWNRDRDGNRDGSRDQNWSNNRDRNPSWNGRNPTYSDHNRDNRRDDTYRRNDNRNGWSNRDGWNDRGRDNDHRWSNNWRQDRRYDWSGYRSSNRNHFRMPRYYAPYRGYNYSRLSIGLFLNSGFYGSNYWINDPWSYRLPPAYAGYRWVRYYNDVILVDTYTGEVADVIHNFFW